MYQQYMLLKLRKPILKYTLNKYRVHWLSSFKNLKLPISKIPVTIIALKASGRDCTNNNELLHKIGVLQRYDIHLFVFTSEL